DNLNTKDKANTWEIRRRIGMVFQNPDNQIVASVVEKDVAFGLENLGIPSKEIRKRVDEALDVVGLSNFRNMEPHYLSGGQKQRLAIAGILAMHPECIILDEPTSMLDPKGKREVLDLLVKLNTKFGITIIFITQDMEEVLLSRRTIGILDGRIIFNGTPREIFNDLEILDLLSLSLTKVGEIVYYLRQQGINIPYHILKREELVEFLCKLN
ncbi:MAG TPA: ATP-binding cassette domain-containing protein, partial [Candidatus Atribacteria bacterium]|nr:ATP-binding cassette domain-containing protein [Candidatus Atribacteria bacterium]